MRLRSITRIPAGKPPCKTRVPGVRYAGHPLLPNLSGPCPDIVTRYKSIRLQDAPATSKGLSTPGNETLCFFSSILTTI